jgi:L-lactate dehydrogenase complex protein LldG
MTDGRFNVLASIDRQIRVGALPPGARLEHPGPPPVSEIGGDLVARFEAEATALAVTVHRVGGDAAAIDTVLGLLRERHASQVLAWDAEWLNCPGLATTIAANGITLESCWLPPDSEARKVRLAALDPVPVGLTGAVAGLADTGSLAVISGPGRGRMASLLPPAHIAVLRAAQIVPSLTHFLASRPDAADAGSNLVFITGPSRTGDIEMTLSRGVHGPGVVHVVVIEGQ